MTAPRQLALDELPEGWTESRPGGLATRNHPTLGGIIDSNRTPLGWFVIFHREDLQPIDGLASRADAFKAFFEAIER
jgi:putative DNA primase/helicase